MTNQLVQGILLGGYYALIASGLSFMFSVMRIINLAHGSLAVLAAFALFVLADRFGISPFLGLLIVLPGMAVIGWALQRFILERGSRVGVLVPILATFGLAIVIDNLLFQQFGANTRSLAPYIGDFSYDSWQLTDDVSVGKLAVLTFVAAVAILGALQAILSFTPLGRAIRATSEDPDTVGLIGIDARRVNAVATAIAFLIDRISTGGDLAMIFLAGVLIGGAGSVWGTLLGGIILALGQSVGAAIAPQGFLIGGHLVFLVALFARLFMPGSGFPAMLRTALRRSA